MSGTELIMGMEEIVQEMSELKEALAQKFYDHYEQMNYNKLNIARTVGPNLGRMVEHLIKENKRLQEENESLQEEVEELEGQLEQAKEVAYHCGVELFCDSDEEEEEVITDLNGKKMKVPTEEQLKDLGVSREDFIMLAKQSDCSQ
jgi:predicted RNase H-like nuclease (RuvC/YqgF family)